MTVETKERRTSRIVWALAAVLLAGAVWMAVRSARSGVNELSWNVRDAIADELDKDIAALTTQDLARVTALSLHGSSTPYIRLPSAPARVQRFIPERKTAITDQDLLHLEKLSALRLLFLHGTQVTDAGLVHLAKLSALQKLWLSETQVTEKGVKRLKESLPNCVISGYPT